MIKVAAAVIVDNGMVFAVKRSDKVRMPLRWHVPGGKLDDGETFEQALRRELFEELGIAILVGDEIANLRCSFTYGQYDVHFFRAAINPQGPKPQLKSDENCDFGWFELKDIVLQRPDWLEGDQAAARLALLEGQILDK